MTRYGLPLATVLYLYPGFVAAIGLGDIQLASSLHQRLEAEIELFDMRDIDLRDIQVGLASNEAFASLGIERPAHLRGLHFAPLRRGAGGVIQVTSSQPIDEPYLTFVVELARPNGTLLREYTVLLDPPEAVSPGLAVASHRERQAPSAPLAPGSRYVVQGGDSLWLIARRLRNAGVAASQDQLMQAIHQTNPDAFANGRIDRLKQGASLLLPVDVEPAALAAASPLPESPAAASETPRPRLLPSRPRSRLRRKCRRRTSVAPSRRPQWSPPTCRCCVKSRSSRPG